jgi:hypothetical protein
LLKRDYDRVNSELFDPRIINHDYEPHDESARVRGYLPENNVEERTTCDDAVQTKELSRMEEETKVCNENSPVDGSSSGEERAD